MSNARQQGATWIKAVEAKPLTADKYLSGND